MATSHASAYHDRRAALRWLLIAVLALVLAGILLALTPSSAHAASLLGLMG